MKRIYLASSWRNLYQAQVLELLREAGHEVYDFRNPQTLQSNHPTRSGGGFSWKEIDPDWERWSVGAYVEALQHPAAVRGFDHDFSAMQWSDTCVLLQPAGPSAAIEAGWCKGSGRRLIVHVGFGIREPDLMFKMADAITVTLDDLLAEVGR